MVASLERGPGRFLRRGDLARAREQTRQAEEAYQVARQAADRAADRERAARQAQQQHEAHQEAHPELRARERELMREKGWRKRVAVRAVEILQPEWSRDLGERPATVKGGRAWDRAVEQVVEYRQQRNVTDPERPLGPEPHGKDISLEQRRAWRHAMGAIDRMRDLAGDHTERPDRMEATGRYPSDRRSDRGQPDHRDRERALFTSTTRSRHDVRVSEPHALVCQDEDTWWGLHDLDLGPHHVGAVVLHGRMPQVRSRQPPG